MKAFVFLAEGFEEIEAVTVIDVLRRAKINVITVSVNSYVEVKGAHNIKVTADMTFDDTDFSDGDMLILPGGMPGTKNLNDHLGLAGLIKDYAKKDKWICAICAAPMILGKLGLLNNISAACYPGFEKYLKGADIKTGQKVVRHKKFITSRGPGTAVYFALKLAETLKGEETALVLKKGMLVEP